jgi:glycogen debranching enzyme
MLLPSEATISFDPAPADPFEQVTGDAIATRPVNAQGYLCAFLDSTRLAGQLPPQTRMLVDGSPVDAPLQQVARGRGCVAWAVRSDRRWGLIVTEGSAPDAAWREAVLNVDLPDLVEQRNQFLRQITSQIALPKTQARLLAKALSVMKVNYESPQGIFNCRWTTPDRWPHRFMWLWDSAFHAVAMSLFATDLAQEALRAVLDQVREDGLLVHMHGPEGPRSEISQPPILGWALWILAERGADKDWLADCLDPLWRHLEWMRTQRDRNGNDVPEWFIEGDPFCRCGECGLDNSPRFDRALLLDAVDFGSWLSHDYRCVSDLAGRLGRSDIARAAGEHAHRIGQATNMCCWSADQEFYFDRDHEGSLSPVKAVTGFMPLFAGIATTDQAQAVARHLRNPATFGPALPVPTVSVDSGTFCKDMWRGPVWMNLNYHVYLGLKRYRLDEEAEGLRQTMLEAIGHWYQKEGCLFEFYDALDVTSPRELDRKQRLARGKGMAPISDYHWTAVVTAALLAERVDLTPPAVGD